MQKMSSDSETEYVSWTPEELMRDYRGEIKRDIFVRIMEWYSNAEVEAKINDNRTDGKKIQNPNFYAEIKRNVDNIALREGRLPTEYRLQWDKRRVANLEVRFGHDNISVRMMRQSIAAREAVKGELTLPVLSLFPSPVELEAARPDNGKKLQKGREVKEYWYKFLAALDRHGPEAVRSAYEMRPCTFRDEVARARRITRRLDEVVEIEAKGEIVPQIFFPSPPLQSGHQIYASQITPRSKAKINEKDTPKTKGDTLATTPVPSIETPTRKPSTILLSPHMKMTLSFLRNQLLAHPERLPSLDSIAARFEHPLLCDDQTYQEREKFESCETRYTIEKWWAWCDEKGDAIVERNGNVRIATYLVHCIRLWQEQVWHGEQASAEALGESFLTYTMGRLENLEEIDEEIEDELCSYDGAAWEAQLKEPIEKSCLGV